eukprot:scaffold100963_cov69-Phaeocystis_antarctica.AAC.1
MLHDRLEEGRLFRGKRAIRRGFRHLEERRRHARRQAKGVIQGGRSGPRVGPSSSVCTQQSYLSLSVCVRFYATPLSAPLCQAVPYSWGHYRAAIARPLGEDEVILVAAVYLYGCLLDCLRLHLDALKEVVRPAAEAGRQVAPRRTTPPPAAHKPSSCCDLASVEAVRANSPRGLATHMLDAREAAWLQHQELDPRVLVEQVDRLQRERAA